MVVVLIQNTKGHQLLRPYEMSFSQKLYNSFSGFLQSAPPLRPASLHQSIPNFSSVADGGSCPDLNVCPADLPRFAALIEDCALSSFTDELPMTASQLASPSVLSSLCQILFGMCADSDRYPYHCSSPTLSSSPLPVCTKYIIQYRSVHFLYKKICKDYLCCMHKHKAYNRSEWMGMEDIGNEMGISTSLVYKLYTSGLSKVGLSLFRQLRRTEPTPTELQTLIGDENFLCLIEQIMLEKKIRHKERYT